MWAIGFHFRTPDRKDIALACIVCRLVTIKDLDLGRALSSQVADNEAWRAERPGQMTVPRGQMVAAIAQIIEAASREPKP